MSIDLTQTKIFRISDDRKFKHISISSKSCQIEQNAVPNNCLDNSKRREKALSIGVELSDEESQNYIHLQHEKSVNEEGKNQQKNEKI